jgi:ABC-type transport system substrate-binding protein
LTRRAYGEVHALAVLDTTTDASECHHERPRRHYRARESTTRYTLEVATPGALSGPLRVQTREQVQAEINDELSCTEAMTPGGAFLDASTGDIRTIHPLLADDEDSLAVVSLLYDGLVSSDVRTGEPARTGVTDSWEIAPDRVTCTFHLNTDATWHDGVGTTS